MSKMQFKFKSVGEKPDARRNDNTGRLKPRNLGFKTPVRNSGTPDIFDMHQDPRDQIKDNFRNLILTNKGERLGMPGYGVSLKSISYDFSNREDYEAIVQKQIVEQAQIHLPVITVQRIIVDVNDDIEQYNVEKQGLALLKLNVSYSIPVLREDKQVIQVSLFIGG